MGWIIAGGIIALLVFVRLTQTSMGFQRMKGWFGGGNTTSTPPTGTAGATPAVAGAPAPARTTNPRTRWLRWLIAIGVVGWCWYSIEKEVGFPGAWVASKTYEHSVDVTVWDLKAQKICDIRPGKRVFDSPLQDSLYHPNRGAMRGQAGFFVLEPVNRYSIKLYVHDARVNGTRSGESVTIGSDGCATLTWHLVDQKTWGEAKVLGGPFFQKNRYVSPEVDGTPLGFSFSLRFK